MQIKITATDNFKTPRGNLERAVKSAIRRTFAGLKRDIGQKIKQRYTLASSNVTRTLQTRISGLSGTLTSTGAKIPVEKFRVKPRRRLKRQPAGGVFAENVRGQGGFIRRAFLQKSGGVYERTGRARFPIKRIKGPSAPSMLSSIPVSSFIEQKIEERLNKNLMHEIKFFV